MTRRLLPCMTDRDAWTDGDVHQRQEAREACTRCYRIEACYEEAMTIEPSGRVGVWGAWDFTTFPMGRKETSEVLERRAIA